MGTKKHKIVMVDLLHPCTACLITDNLLKESLEKVKKSRDDVDVEYIVIDHPNELAGIEGVEVEKLPLLIIDGEQVSAGSFLTPKQINTIICQMDLE